MKPIVELTRPNGAENSAEKWKSFSQLPSDKLCIGFFTFMEQAGILDVKNIYEDAGEKKAVEKICGLLDTCQEDPSYKLLSIFGGNTERTKREKLMKEKKLLSAGEAIKLRFRHSEVKLISKETAEKLLNAFDESTPKFNKAKKVLASIPRLGLLKIVLDHLIKVAGNFCSNQMSMYDLSEIWADLLMEENGEDNSLVLEGLFEYAEQLELLPPGAGLRRDQIIVA